MAWKHRLSNLNECLMLADCAYCGPQVKVMKQDRLTCWAGRQKGVKIPGSTMTWEEKINLFLGNPCPICLKALTLETAVLDHNHINYKLRGWLCNHCNLALGLFKDDKESLLRAVKYLEEDGEHMGQQMLEAWKEKYE